MGVIAQKILEALPVLPKGVRPTDLLEQFEYPDQCRTGFRHSSGEWNFLYTHEGRMYRLPEGIARVILSETHGQGKYKGANS